MTHHAGCCCLILLGWVFQGCHNAELSAIPLHDFQVNQSAENAAPTELQVFRTAGSPGLQVGASWELLAKARGGQGPVRFHWSATSGSLSAEEGSLVTWTATEPVGRAEIVIEAQDQEGNRQSAAFGVSVPFGLPLGIVEDVRDQLGYYCSLVLDPNDRPMIAYFNQTHPSLRFARYNGASWDIEVVEGYGLDIGGQAGMHAAAAVDASGGVHLAYLAQYTSQDDLSVNYATKVGADWRLVTVDPSYGDGYFPVSIQINPSTNKPELLYQSLDGQSVVHAVCSGDCTSAASWAKAVVYTHTGYSSIEAFSGGLVIDSSGKRHASFSGRAYDSNWNYRGGLSYSQNSGAGWAAAEAIIAQRYTNSRDMDVTRMALDHSGQPLLLHADGIYHRSAAGGWTLSTAEQNGVDGTADYARFDIACDNNRTPPDFGVVWFTTTHGNALELVKTNSRGYFDYTYLGNIDTLAEARTSVAIDSTGAAHVCWVDGGALQYQ